MVCLQEITLRMRSIKHIQGKDVLAKVLGTRGDGSPSIRVKRVLMECFATAGATENQMACTQIKMSVPLSDSEA